MLFLQFNKWCTSVTTTSLNKAREEHSFSKLWFRIEWIFCTQISPLALFWNEFYFVFFFPILLSLSWVLHFYSNKGQQNCFSASESLTTSIIYMLQTKLLNGYNWDSCFWSKSPWNIRSSTAAAEKPWSEAHHKQK